MYCGNCGAQSSGNDRFCNNCGADLQNATYIAASFCYARPHYVYIVQIALTHPFTFWHYCTQLFCNETNTAPSNG